MRRVDGVLVSGDCGVELLQHPLRSPSPPATATQKHSPISPRCEKESGTPQLEIREQFMASYGPGLVCLLHTLTHKHTTFLSFREHIILEFPSLALSKRFGVNKLQLVNWNVGPLVPLLSCTIWLILLFLFPFLCPPSILFCLSADLRSYDYGIWTVDPPRQSEPHCSVA